MINRVLKKKLSVLILECYKHQESKAYETSTRGLGAIEFLSDRAVPQSMHEHKAATRVFICNASVMSHV